MTRANAKWIRLMAVIGCTTMWMASCKHAPDAQMKASYATMKVSTANKELTTPYSATIRGRQDIDIYPQVSGTIERLCVTEGEVVRKGQLLFVGRKQSKCNKYNRRYSKSVWKYKYSIFIYFFLSDY